MCHICLQIILPWSTKQSYITKVCVAVIKFFPDKSPYLYGPDSCKMENISLRVRVWVFMDNWSV